ncbi:hypothetical protein MASR1M42_09420 [Azonexus hydrophilus]
MSTVPWLVSKLAECVAAAVVLSAARRSRADCEMLTVPAAFAGAGAALAAGGVLRNDEGAGEATLDHGLTA